GPPQLFAFKVGAHIPLECFRTGALATTRYATPWHSVPVYIQDLVRIIGLPPPAPPPPRVPALAGSGAVRLRSATLDISYCSGPRGAVVGGPRLPASGKQCGSLPRLLDIPS